MAKPKRTAREEIERAFHVSFKLPEQAAELLDDYRAEVLAEAHAMILAASKGLLDAIDEADLAPSDWGRHQEWCDAADVLSRAAKAATAN
ncbi:hypothetical protein ACFXDE_01920 [Kitasatospora sp. NPDC059408]|uniref:hypothetical protein n=1 Tax=Kitasatospora sp. NPDC059408 TaxID=3346823 RepID=UPI003682ADCF